MIKDWVVQALPQDKFENRLNCTEQYALYYKKSFVGRICYCPFGEITWAYILNEKNRAKFYKLNDKFIYTTIKKTNKGRLVKKQQRGELAEYLVRKYKYEQDMRDKNFYCRVILSDLFDKTFDNHVSHKQILKEIKNELPQITKLMSMHEIKMSSIEILQNQNYNLKHI